MLLELCGCAEKGIYFSQTAVPQLRKLIIARILFFCFLVMMKVESSLCHDDESRTIYTSLLFLSQRYSFQFIQRIILWECPIESFSFLSRAVEIL